MIKPLIQKLKKFTKVDFPIADVSSYLKNLTITQEELKKYDLRRTDTYTRNLIHKNKDFEIMILCWPPNKSAPIHGHEGEKCWARVQTGQLKICNYKQISSKPLKLNKIQEWTCNPGFLDGPADIHSVENISKNNAISLHVYAKPYDSCDIYNLENGTINRVKLSYHSIDGIIC